MIQEWPVGGSIALSSLDKKLTAIIEVYAALKKNKLLSIKK